MSEKCKECGTPVDEVPLQPCDAHMLQDVQGRYAGCRFCGEVIKRYPLQTLKDHMQRCQLKHKVRTAPDLPRLKELICELIDKGVMRVG